jgi:hypothetical protein
VDARPAVHEGVRHQPFDDSSIPDFTDAWNQAEGYLAYTIRNRGYLLQEKGLRFEDPKCLLEAFRG